MNMHDFSSKIWGYRNVSYVIDYSENQGYIVLDTWDDKGEYITHRYPWYSYLYYEHPEGSYTSMFNTPLKKMIFPTVLARHTWLKQNESKRIFECLPPQREFLINTFDNQNEKPDFIKHDLRIHFLDIEVAIESEFPHPDDSKYPINVLSVYDSHLKQYHVFCMKGAFTNTNDKIYHQYRNEKLLLQGWLDWHKSNFPDVFAGWNIYGFDIPYIINRVEKVLGTSTEISPIKSVRNVSINLNKKTKELTNTYIIEGISIMDQMILYRDKFEIREPLSSYSLNFVSEHELNAKKLEYEGSMRDFYINHYELFVEYNIQDIALCVQLEQKKQHIQTTRLICAYGLCELECIYRSAPYILGALILQGRALGKIVITKDTSSASSDATFTGAFVFPPQVGVYRRGITSFDLNSLYPNIMITLNISPETKICKLTDEYADGAVITLPSGKTRTITTAQLDNIKSECTRSSNNVFYQKFSSKPGIIPIFLDRLYTGRKIDRAEGFKYEQELAKLKQKEVLTLQEETRVKELKIGIEQYDLAQFTKKIFLNSIYGSLGSAYFPMFDLDNAEAVTITGQHINKAAGEFISAYIKKMVNDTSDFEPRIYGDTDSLYYNMDKVVDYVIGKDTPITNDNIFSICNVLNKLSGEVNKFLVRLCTKHLNSETVRIEYKREMFASEGIFIAKKRYALHVREDEGKLKDTFKYMGIELKTAAHPPCIKTYLEKIYTESMINEWSSSKYADVIYEIYNDFISKCPDEISLYKGYNTEKSSNGFLTPEKGVGGAAKGALLYNHIIEDLGLSELYPSIRVGDKVRFCYLNKKNKYGIDSISWPATISFPKEFSEIFEVNYYVMFDKNVLKALKHVIQINNWRNIDPCHEVEIDIMSL